MLALLDTPTAGHYWLNGRATDRLSPGDKARVRNLDVGLIFQSFNLIADLTVYENVEYPLTVRGVSQAERKERSCTREQVKWLPPTVPPLREKLWRFTSRA